MPDALVLLLLGVALVATTGLLVGAHHPWVTTVLGLGLGAALVVLARDRRAATRVDAVGTLVAIAVAWALLIPSLAFAGEHLAVQRDPGFYTVTAKWLTTHGSPFISSDAAAFGGGEGLLTAASGFTATPAGWWPQGGHLVPAMVSIPGQLGDRWLLSGNAWLATIALLGLYGLSRRLVGPWFALLPMLAVGLSLPWLAFSRLIYTEPVTVAFGFASLSFLERAYRNHSLPLYGIAGALAGAPCLARIDGGLGLVALIPAVGLTLALSPGRPWCGAARLATFTFSGAAMFALGWLELARNSPVYLTHLGSQLRVVAGLLVLSSAVTSLAFAVARHGSIRTRLVTLSRRVALPAAVIVALVGVVLAARPLFWTSRVVTEGTSAYTAMLSGMQEQEGLPVDPARTYDESTVSWLAWYLGWGTVALGVLGLALATWSALRRCQPLPFAMVAMVGGVSILYLNRISITPDQVWAARRLLPVILPGCVVAATILLHALHRRGGWGRGLALIGVAAVALTPAVPSASLFTEPDYRGQFDEVRAICDALPADGRLLIPDPALGYTSMVTLRAWCEAPVAGVPASQPDLLARARASEAGRPLYVLTSDPGLVTWVSPPTPFRTSRVTRWETRLSGPPEDVVHFQRVLYVGVVDVDGRVASVVPGT